MPENGRKDDLFVPDFVKEAEEQIAKGEKLPAQEEVTIKFGKGLAEPFQSKDGREFMRITIPNQDPADKQKTAYEMSLCDWSSDVCSSDLSS